MTSSDSKSKPCKVVYAVTSSGRDFFSSMTRISATAIRISNPKAAIVLACDDHSVAAMRHSRDPLLDEVDELITCCTPAGDCVFRNRFVKTRLRVLYDGPFLFLDSDTLVRDNISKIFLLDTDIACATNHSRNSIEQQLYPHDTAILSTMGWPHRQDVFVNGGVMFYNDTPGAARFCDNWHRKWLSSYKFTKKHYDQPALNAAIFATEPRLEILPHRFNAQFKATPAAASKATIWHFYSSLRGDEPITEFEQLVVNLVKGTELRRSRVESILQHDHPWRRHSWVDDLAARHVMKKDSFDRADSLWFQGRRSMSVGYRILPSIKPVIRLLIGRTMFDRVKRTKSVERIAFRFNKNVHDLTRRTMLPQPRQQPTQDPDRSAGSGALPGRRA